MLGVALIGVGDVAGLHARAVRRCARATLVGVWSSPASDVSSAGELVELRARASEFGCRAYGSLDELLADPAVHAVYVLTPLPSHVALARAAVEAGKHVLVEKPVAESAAEILQLDALAQARGVICAPGHNYVYDAQLERMRDALARGELGQLVQVHILYNIRHGPEVTAKLPGVIEQIMTHHAYTLLFLTGERPRTVSCATSAVANGAVPRENSAVATCTLPSGALAVLQASFAADDHTSEPWSFYVKVLGTEGGARYSYNDVLTNRAGAIHSHTYGAYAASMERQTAHFAAACLGSGPPPLSSLQDAAASATLVAACRASATSSAWSSL